MAVAFMPAFFAAAAHVYAGCEPIVLQKLSLVKIS
jgi:hypothetical protein